MAKIDLNKHVWEGWTVGDFVEELEFVVDMIMRGESFVRPFKTKAEVKAWCMDNQSNIKKNIPGVHEYFCDKYGIK